MAILFYKLSCHEIIHRHAHFYFVLPLLAALSAPASSQDKSIVVASTTSTQDAGLFGHILPLFRSKTGIEVKLIAQGTGQALETGRRGDADVVFVHAKSQEDKFVAEGHGVKRFNVMYNDFVLVGPKGDPADVRGSKDIEGDKRQFNQYGVILVNPNKHPASKTSLGQSFIDWLVSAEGQAAITSFKIEGEQLFFPNADE